MAFVNEWESPHRATERKRRIRATEERKLREWDFDVRAAPVGEICEQKLMNEFKDEIIKRISEEMPNCAGEDTNFE